MPLDVWLYPGAAMSVTTLTKVTLTPAAPGEVPPAGATIIPPQTAAAAPKTATPMAATMAQAAAANLEVAKQGVEAAQVLTNQQTAEAQAAFDAALKASNEAAEKLTQAAQAAGVTTTPPWSVTFTEHK